MLPIHILEWDLIVKPGSLSPTGEARSLPVSPTPTQPPTPTPREHDAYPAPAHSPDAGVLSSYSYPRRVPVDPAWMSTWPFVYRQVYNLSTGQYSEQDIGRLLHYPLTELIKVFEDLQRMKIIQRRT